MESAIEKELNKIRSELQPPSKSAKKVKKVGNKRKRGDIENHDQTEEQNTQGIMDQINLVSPGQIKIYEPIETEEIE